MSMLSRMATLGAGVIPQTYVDDVFNTYLYGGTGATQTISNGIDLAGQGGMVWIKSRSAASNHCLYDTNRGVFKDVNTNDPTAETSASNSLTAFNNNGFSLGALAATNASGGVFAAWTFRKAAKFFDVVTYTGTGANRTISHSLGTEPGMIFVKRTDTTGDWQVYHRSLLNTEYMVLNSTAAKATGATRWNSTSATSSAFTVGTDATVNAVGGTYVAYLFAHDTSTTGLIQCGSFTTDGSGNATLNLGWEPQYILYKNSATAQGWAVVDINRGMTVGLGAELLQPNLDSAASTTNATFSISPNGVFIDTTAASTAYIYMAIRRSNKPPTSGTQVFNPVLYTGTNADNRLVNTGILTDMAFIRQRNDTALAGFVVGDRLRGQPYFLTGVTGTEVNDTDAFDQVIVSATEYGTAFGSMNGFWVGNDPTAKLNASTAANNHVAYAFKRAPGFFEAVCYTGAGLGDNKTHNLGAKPELMLIKRRNASTASTFAYESVTSNTEVYFGRLNETTAFAALGAGYPTSSTFGTTATGTDISGGLYVAYLFASVPGISKIGKYVGNGTTQTINCGFTTGARFVLIKRTDSTGDWCVFDTARGIVAGNDPLLRLNATTAESSAADVIDVDNSGFIINQESTTNLNFDPSASGSWVARTSSFGTTGIFGVRYGNGLWVAVGSSGKLATSTDGITWTQQTSSFGTTNIEEVNYGNGLWVAVGASGKLATSTDGITWTQQTSSFGTTTIQGVAYGNGLWVAVGASGKLATSTDGITWTQQTSSFGTTTINDVAYGNGLWIAVGASGKLATSTDGITWTQGSAGFGNNSINGVAYDDNGLWVIVGDVISSAGGLAISTDGLSWSNRSSDISTNISDVAYGNGYWVAVGESGNASRSSTGSGWTGITVPFSTNNINGVAYGNGVWVAVGASGILATSSPEYLYLAIA